MNDTVDAVELTIFSSRINAVCEEMGVALQRAAFSPNIKERLDFSCAVFDRHGALCAQAAHIPVHLGSMAYAMAGVVSKMHWMPGDMVVLNDPYLGGTHLPDVTLIAPYFHDGRLAAFVCNRAHHADIGAASPGSMPFSTTLDEEGLLIAPSYLLRQGAMDSALMRRIVSATQKGWQTEGDFAAQISANRLGLSRLSETLQTLTLQQFETRLMQLNRYGENLCLSMLASLGAGTYTYTDMMDDDGFGSTDIPITVRLELSAQRAHVDFTGTAAQVPGNINCPLSVTAAAVFYAFRCLMPAQTPACAGSLKPITIMAPPGSLIHANPPAAVAAGNVETSSRIVDAVFGALCQAAPDRVPAASQGTMNNVAMGARGAAAWDYYETIGGGMGASSRTHGLSAVQTHLTNTRNTPIEDLEMNFPLRITRYAVRRGSGGNGRYRGGDGIVREYFFNADAQVSLLTERRRHAPWGCQGGQAGACGENRLNDRIIPAKNAFSVRAGDRLTILTPGGGGWGK